MILILLISKHENRICFPRGFHMIWAEELSCVSSLFVSTIFQGVSQCLTTLWANFSARSFHVTQRREIGTPHPWNGKDFIFYFSTCPDAGQLPSYLPQTGHRVKNGLNSFLWGALRDQLCKIFSSWYKAKCLMGQELHWDFRR